MCRCGTCASSGARLRETLQELRKARAFARRYKSFMDNEVVNAWLSFKVLVAWVPFAVVAGILDTWDTEGGRAFRAQLMHPFRTFRVNHPRLFAHAH
jgi:hypothetical protein